MRFDDRLATVLEDQPQSETLARLQYSQLIDLLSRRPGKLSIESSAHGFRRLRNLSKAIDDTQKLVSVQAMAGRIRSPALVRFLAGDSPIIANAAIMAARLPDDQWAALIPELPVRARGFLRNRDDLGEQARRRLRSMGITDFLLSDRRSTDSETELISDGDAVDDDVVDDGSDDISVLPPSPARASILGHQNGDTPPPPAANDREDRPSSEETDGRQISALLQRIEAFQRQRPRGDAPELPLEVGAARTAARAITARADARGTLMATDADWHRAISGLSLGQVRRDDGLGVEAATALAFARRVPITHGTIWLGNAGVPWAGTAAQDGGPTACPIRAIPRFTQGAGQFAGYDCIIMPPAAFAEGSDAAQALDTADSPDQLRQLLHELRTPVGAIVGFSEIITQQLFGPVTSRYRQLSGSITDDANTLLHSFDDLDLALKLDHGVLAADTAECEPETVLADLKRTLELRLSRTGVELVTQADAGMPTIRISRELALKCIQNMALAAIRQAPGSTTLHISIHRVGDETDIAVEAREAKTKSPNATTITDQPATAPPIFTSEAMLTMVARLATIHGGAIHDESPLLRLRLPLNTA